MSVELDPAELHFKRPFQREVSQVLKLRNPNSVPVAFKVKTTAPKQYCVRPNSGRIEPGAEEEVQVLLQAMKEDPPLDYKCRDKFLVQSVGVPAGRDFNNWSHIEQTDRTLIQEKKIRVAFLPADDSTPAKPNGFREETPHRHPSPDAATPQPPSTAPTGQMPVPESRPKDNKYLAEAGSPQVQERSPAREVAAPIPTSVEELQAQLAEAHSVIAKLKEQTDDSGLRRRKGDSSAKAEERMTSGPTSLVAHQTQEGVPIKVVAGLCFLCFLLAYFFF
ncbi:VAMP-associated protein [Trichodelitschia bisporula]|uniref:VAMP-associated protein n=1 Tax=Trichodelitschia bisporula TaxID=703511 RepID=A0A6G1HTM8_9PEZI|nr:VAMP-associated protein [Trichodelitschia bisporula]